MKKELTREQVIAAINSVYEAVSSVYPGIAEKIADALGLEAPKPFERVSWVCHRGDGSGCFFSNAREAKEAWINSEDRVFPALVTELSPDDKRVKEMK